jgi:hypothetical protein
MAQLGAENVKFLAKWRSVRTLYYLVPPVRRLLDIPLMTLDEAKNFDWNGVRPDQLIKPDGHRFNFRMAPHFHEIRIVPDLPKSLREEILSKGKVLCPTCQHGRDHGTVVAYAAKHTINSKIQEMQTNMAKLEELAMTNADGATFKVGLSIPAGHRVIFNGREYLPDRDADKDWYDQQFAFYDENGKRVVVSVNDILDLHTHASRYDDDPKRFFALPMRKKEKDVAPEVTSVGAVQPMLALGTQRLVKTLTLAPESRPKLMAALRTPEPSVLLRIEGIKPP